MSWTTRGNCTTCNKDWTQSEDIAAKNPGKLKEMQELFWKEAEKYQVLPLDASLVTRLITPRPSITAGRNVFTWTRPLTGTPNGDAPSVLNTSYNFKAEVEIPQGGAEGMLITQGGRFAGYGFYLLKGKPVFLWNLVDLKRISWEGPEALTAGKHTLEFDFKYDGLGAATLAFNSMSGIGRGGTGVLKVDGKAVATQKMKHTIPFILQWDENLDVGSDTGSPVNDADYQVPFKFTGKTQQDDADHRPAEADAGGHQETRRSPEEQPGKRVAASINPGSPRRGCPAKRPARLRKNDETDEVPIARVGMEPKL